MYTLEGRWTCAECDGPTPYTRGAHAAYSLYVLVPDALIFLQEGDHQLFLLLAQLKVLLVPLVFVLARLPTAVTGLRRLRNTALYRPRT